MFDDIMLGNALPIMVRNDSHERIQLQSGIPANSDIIHTTPSISSPTQSSQPIYQLKKAANTVEKVIFPPKAEEIALKPVEFPFQYSSAQLKANVGNPKVQRVSKFYKPTNKN